MAVPGHTYGLVGTTPMPKTQATADESPLLMRMLPKLQIYCPATPAGEEDED